MLGVVDYRLLDLCDLLGPMVHAVVDSWCCVSDLGGDGHLRRHTDSTGSPTACTHVPRSHAAVEVI